MTVGVNYYSPTVVDRTGKQVVLYPTSASGQQLHPRAFYDLLVRIHRDYHLPIIITETGIPDYPGRPPLADGFRINFVRDHLRVLLRAVNDGARVDGVHLWSLMDNWEWARGFTQRWGLVRVDYDTQARIPKQSAGFVRRPRPDPHTGRLSVGDHRKRERPTADRSFSLGPAAERACSGARLDMAADHLPGSSGG